jgi:hypothetical protein
MMRARSCSFLFAGSLAVACGSGASGFDGADGGHDAQAQDARNHIPVLGKDASDRDAAQTDPTTCAEAEATHSYVGCDFWPTVTANPVWSIFDFAAVVANAGTRSAEVIVTGPYGTNQHAVVEAGQLVTVYLPWVPALKGGDQGASCFGTGWPPPSSVLAQASAYHLVTTAPVTVYQFNALEYVGEGGPPAKNWSSCPGSQPGSGCSTKSVLGCYSFTNDASLLLPTTALTGNYRVTGHGGLASAGGAYVTITGTAENTTVNLKVSSTGLITAGTGVPVTQAGDTYTFTLGAGDVAQLVGDETSVSDLSGSLVTASQPVQVLTGNSCLSVPGMPAFTCDHVEESNLPAETLGTDYLVVQPTGPHGVIVGQDVRVYGNFDETTLSYPAGAPAGCPTKVDAGQVVDCGTIAQDFEIIGDHSFAVGIFTQSAQVVDALDQPPKQMGDPDESLPTPVAQYRSKYVFLAPTDYEENFLVVIQPTGATVTLDGKKVTTTAAPVGATGYGVLRLPLEAGNGGAHVLTATRPVGIQVMGYGSYTSYQYPGGLALEHIAPPPIH